jgi:hypothetical protein
MPAAERMLISQAGREPVNASSWPPMKHHFCTHAMASHDARMPARNHHAPIQKLQQLEEGMALVQSPLHRLSGKDKPRTSSMAAKEALWAHIMMAKISHSGTTWGWCTPIWEAQGCHEQHVASPPTHSLHPETHGHSQGHVPGSHQLLTRH